MRKDGEEDEDEGAALEEEEEEEKCNLLGSVPILSAQFPGGGGRGNIVPSKETPHASAPELETIIRAEESPPPPTPLDETEQQHTL